MTYKIVEMQEKAESYNNNEYTREKFITSFQNRVNEFLNNGYVPSGGICVSHVSVANGNPGFVHLAQALIKE